MVESSTKRKVKLLDLAILLYHVHKGARDQEIGFEDALESLNSITAQLNKSVYIESRLLESALWSANLMDEKGNFNHPSGKTFDEWVFALVGKYNRFYNTIEGSE